jgi:hypothetical protein
VAIVTPDLRWTRAVPGSAFGLVRALLPIVVTAFPLVVLTYIACSPFFGPRIALTLLLMLMFPILALIRPLYAVIACLILGPYIGIVRRVFDSALGVAGLDPLLVVIPITLSTALISTCFIRKKQLKVLWVNSVTFRLFAVFMSILMLEVANPLQGGFAIGLTGAFYRLIPMFAVFIVAASPRSMERWVLRIILITAIVEALYGLQQTFFGFNGPEREFITRSITGSYRSLSVGGVIRAFGTFVSAAEYVYYLDVSVGVAFAYAVVASRRHQWRRAAVMFSIVLLSIVAVIFEAHRLSLLLITGVVLFVLAVQQANLRRTAVLVIGIVLVAFLVQQNLPTSLGGGGVNRLLTHIFGSLSGDNILRDASFQGHVQLVLDALWTGVTSPLGRGLGASSQASVKFGGGSVSSELDITDIIIASGYVGGVLYVTILFRVVAAAVRLFRSTGRPEHLAAGAAIVAGLGQILGPGYYVYGATLLAVIGCLIREEVRHACHRDLA